MAAPWEHMPLYKKAMEIRKLVDSIVEISSEAEMYFECEVEAQIIDNCINFMIENSLVIPSKIAGAFKESTPYGLKMENATIIRKAANDLLTDAGMLAFYEFKEVEYLELLQNEIDEFRILFAEWVQTFDIWNYHIDRWGLFNPPGINYDDLDPDDDFDIDEDINSEDDLF